MTFPRRTDVARHLARKPGLAFKLRPQIVSIDQVPRTDLQFSSVGRKAFLGGSAIAEPALGANDLSIAVGSAHNPDKLVL